MQRALGIALAVIAGIGDVDIADHLVMNVAAQDQDVYKRQVQLSRDLRARPEPGARQTDWSY